MQTTRIEGKTILNARKYLFDLIDYLEELNLDYHLEGGTLLGFVREGEFLEWDHDIDISIPQESAAIFYKNRQKLWRKGYRMTQRKSTVKFGPISVGEHRIFKVKGLLPSFFKMFSKKLENNALVIDVFIKFCSKNEVFWLAKDSIMKAPGHHYSGYDKLDYRGRMLRIPLEHKDYLTHKYGDWSVPVKEWNCAKDEKSKVSSIIA